MRGGCQDWVCFGFYCHKKSNMCWQPQFRGGPLNVWRRVLRWRGVWWWGAEAEDKSVLQWLVKERLPRVNKFIRSLSFFWTLSTEFSQLSRGFHSVVLSFQQILCITWNSLTHQPETKGINHFIKEILLDLWRTILTRKLCNFMGGKGCFQVRSH